MARLNWNGTVVFVDSTQGERSEEYFHALDRTRHYFDARKRRGSGTMTAEELAENGFNLAPGSQVYWEDPCEGVSSGYYRVVRICTEDGRVSDVSDLLQPEKQQRDNGRRLCLGVEMTRKRSLKEKELDERARRTLKFWKVRVNMGRPAHAEPQCEYFARHEEALKRQHELGKRFAELTDLRRPAGVHFPRHCPRCKMPIGPVKGPGWKQEHMVSVL